MFAEARVHESSSTGASVAVTRGETISSSPGLPTGPGSSFLADPFDDFQPSAEFQRRLLSRMKRIKFTRMLLAAAPREPNWLRERYLDDIPVEMPDFGDVSRFLERLDRWEKDSRKRSIMVCQGPEGKP